MISILHAFALGTTCPTSPPDFSLTSLTFDGSSWLSGTSTPICEDHKHAYQNDYTCCGENTKPVTKFSPVINIPINVPYSHHYSENNYDNVDNALNSEGSVNLILNTGTKVCLTWDEWPSMQSPPHGVLIVDKNEYETCPQSASFPFLNTSLPEAEWDLRPNPRMTKYTTKGQVCFDSDHETVMHFICPGSAAMYYWHLVNTDMGCIEYGDEHPGYTFPYTDAQARNHCCGPYCDDTILPMLTWPSSYDHCKMGMKGRITWKNTAHAHGSPTIIKNPEI